MKADTAISNIPIQMISMSDTTGDITPLRFRLEHSDHLIETVQIQQTLSTRECNFAGRKCMKYVCKAVRENREILFEITYLIETHRWMLSNILN